MRKQRDMCWRYESSRLNTQIVIIDWVLCIDGGEERHLQISCNVRNSHFPSSWDFCQLQTMGSEHDMCYNFFLCNFLKKIIKICCWKLLHFLILPFPTLSYWVRFTWYLELCILSQDFLKQLLIFKYLHLLGDGGGFHYMLTKQYCRYLILCKCQTFVIISFNSKLSEKIKASFQHLRRMLLEISQSYQYLAFN